MGSRMAKKEEETMMSTSIFQHGSSGSMGEQERGGIRAGESEKR